MLCSTNKDNDFASFSGKIKRILLNSIMTKLSPEKIEVIKTAINKLDESLKEDKKFQDKNISVLCLV